MCHVASKIGSVFSAIAGGLYARDSWGELHLAWTSLKKVALVVLGQSEWTQNGWLFKGKGELSMDSDFEKDSHFTVCFPSHSGFLTFWDDKHGIFKTFFLWFLAGSNQKIISSYPKRPPQTSDYTILCLRGMMCFVGRLEHPNWLNFLIGGNPWRWRGRCYLPRW